MQFTPPKTVRAGIVFFTLLPFGGFLLYLAGELVFAPWRELPRWGRILKIAALIALPLALVLIASKRV